MIFRVYIDEVQDGYVYSNSNIGLQLAERFSYFWIKLSNVQVLGNTVG